ncbi:hypothetical protein [Nocardia sp. NPDC049707]|uniref:hypothetical protein n=1 Tax=Nocardia sp. NPDC049707 TaxID=3154735 RepID=UPI0034270252
MVGDWADFVIGVCIAGAVALLITLVAVLLWPRRIPKGCGVYEIRARVLRERRRGELLAAEARGLRGPRTELLVGPPMSVELMARFANAVREWAEVT